MNQLNSVILEGTVSKINKSVSKLANGYIMYQFNVTTVRYYKDSNGNNAVETSCFVCECFGKLAEWAHEKLEKNHGVRVVGRIKQTGRKMVCIVVDHIELKPKIKR